MKRIILPSLFSISSNTAFNLSSNSPRYFAPATKAPISSEKIVLSFKFSGTSPFSILCAIPSAMAVFPTPGSPIKIGLFLFLLDKICIARRISLSLPIIGSSLPFRASSTKSFPNLSNASYVLSGLSVIIFLPPLTLSSTVSNCFLFIP